MELPRKQKPTKRTHVLRFSPQSRITSNCMNRQIHKPVPIPEQRNNSSQDTLQDPPAEGLFSPIFLHLWKLTQNCTGYFPQNSAGRYKRHLVLSHNCSRLIFSAVKSSVLNLKRKKKKLFWAITECHQCSGLVARALRWESANEREAWILVQPALPITQCPDHLWSLDSQLWKCGYWN